MNSYAPVTAMDLGFCSQNTPFYYPNGNCQPSAWAPPLKSSHTPHAKLNITHQTLPQLPPPPKFPPQYQNQRVQKFFDNFKQENEKSENTPDYKQLYLESLIKMNSIRSSRKLTQEQTKGLSWGTLQELEDKGLLEDFTCTIN